MTRDGSECWLNTWLVERFPQARILSVSYDSGSRESNSQGRVDMYLITENLVQSLVDLAGVGQICPVVSWSLRWWVSSKSDLFES
ncbi:hypothetical protein R1flu_012912 [Riccia fluitans]|uniref:Uncharacterized protein n=1 Tax=Riccia fluitans TaxID=41844 RepID=A0ABD1ZC49_9MARC